MADEQDVEPFAANAEYDGEAYLVVSGCLCSRAEFAAAIGKIATLRDKLWPLRPPPVNPVTPGNVNLGDPPPGRSALSQRRPA